MMMISPRKRADIGCSLEAMKVHIHDMLSAGDYLVVLDDVWSDLEGRWVELCDLIRTLPLHGRVVLTTRTPDIASKIATIALTKPFYLQQLDQESSFSFMANKWAASYSGDWPADLLEEAGMKVARKCGGVPFLLDYAYRLFYQRPVMEFWVTFLEDLDKIHPDMFWRELLACIDRLPQEKFWQRLLRQVRGLPHGNVVSESASVSYQHLPLDLRGCLLYCSMFPLDYDFDAEELADLLAAEGYIPPIVTIAQRRGFLQQLFDECFYPVQESECGGKSIYKMHKVLHIFVQDMEREISSVIRADQAITQITPKAKSQRSIRRLSLNVYPLTASFPSSLFKLKDLSALLILQEGMACLSAQPHCEIKEIPPVFFQSFKRLHVLSFKATRIRMLPTKFVEPSIMKYLNMSQTDIETVPWSISRLLSLQTLILSHCCRLKKLHGNIIKLAKLQKLDLEGCCNLAKLPRNMRKMKSLEYLNVLDCSLLTELPRGIGQLRNLQALLGYIVSYTDGSTMSELQPLANLQKLGLQSLEKVSDLLDVRYARLQHITNLESLSMRWNVDDGSDGTQAYAVLESLQPHRRLKALEVISYEGKKLPSWMTSTEPYLWSLVEIRLVNLRSCEEVLPPLGILPCLKIAEISGVETIFTISDNFCGYNGTFPSLEKLTFSYMPNLEIWEQAHRVDTFPHLAELVIIQCPKWRALHMDLPSFQKLILWMDNKMLYGSKGGLRGVANSLEHLSICFVEELLASSDCEGLQGLGRLEKLDICGCDEITSLPQGLQHLYSIRSLTIDNCSKLEVLPDWLENLPSLQVIRLSGCPVLHSIPNGLQRHHIIEINVEDCPNLPVGKSGKSLAAQVKMGGRNHD